MTNTLLQALTIAVASGLVAGLVIRLARQGNLTFRYTVGWLGLLLVGVLSSVFIRVTEPLSSAIGVTPGVIVTAVGVLVLILICIQLSISISGLQNQVRRLAEESALVNATSTVKQERGQVLVIVPALNEERSVGTVAEDLIINGFDVLVIDDGSTDRTRDLALQAGATVVSMPYNTGVGGALRTGLRFAAINGYRTVVQCDADGQHPVAHITDLLAVLVDGTCDMVIGSRFANGRAEHMSVSPIRRLAMWTLATSASRAVGVRITDVTSGFRAWQGDLIFALADHLPAYYLGDTYEAVVAAGRAGYRVREIPAPISERLYGTSSASQLRAAQLTARAFATSVLRLHARFPAARKPHLSD